MSTPKLRKQDLDNSWYQPGGSWLKIRLWYFINIIVFKNPVHLGYGVKAGLLRLFGAKVGKRPIIKPGVSIKYPWRIYIGDYVSIGENVWIDNLGDVYFEDQTTVSQGALLLTGNHNYKKQSFDLIIGDIRVQEGAWIGARCVVCPGVTCGAYSILTVGSVATKDLAPHMIHSGNPAVTIRDRILEP